MAFRVNVVKSALLKRMCTRNASISRNAVGAWDHLGEIRGFTTASSFDKRHLQLLNIGKPQLTIGQ